MHQKNFKRMQKRSMMSMMSIAVATVAVVAVKCGVLKADSSLAAAAAVMSYRAALVTAGS